MKKSEISYQRFFQWSKQTNLELVLILMTLLRYMTGKYSHLVIKAELAARSAQRAARPYTYHIRIRYQYLSVC